MIIPDVNILVYAFHSAAPQHKPAQQWLSSALNRHETIGLLDVVATGPLATAGDAGIVAKLLRDFNTEFDTPVPDNLERRFRELLLRDDCLVLLAAEVGFAFLTLRPSPYYDGPVAMLEELYVAPGHRGQGIGTALMGEALALVRQRGAGEMQINVDEVDVDARRFYERHGFTNIEQGSRMLLYIRELG